MIHRLNSYSFGDKVDDESLIIFSLVLNSSQPTVYCKGPSVTLTYKKILKKNFFK